MGLKERLGLVRESEVSATATGAEVGEVGDATAELRNFKKQHKWDPFLDNEKLDTIDSALDSGNLEKQAAVDESLIQENSPYPEVRASVRAMLNGFTL